MLKETPLKNVLRLYRDYTQDLDKSCELHAYCDANLLVRMFLRVIKWCDGTLFGCPLGRDLEPTLAKLRHHIWRTYGNVGKSELWRYKSVVCQIHVANSRKYNSYPQSG